MQKPVEKLIAVKANTVPPPTTLAPALNTFCYHTTCRLNVFSNADDRKLTLTVSARCCGWGFPMQHARLSGPVVRERGMADGLVLSGNKNAIKSYLEGDAGHMRGWKNRLLFFFLHPFSIRRGPLLSCPLASWNCVTDISNTRFLPFSAQNPTCQPTALPDDRVSSSPPNPGSRSRVLPHLSGVALVFLGSTGVPVPIHSAAAASWSHLENAIRPLSADK